MSQVDLLGVESLEQDHSGSRETSKLDFDTPDARQEEIEGLDVSCILPFAIEPDHMDKRKRLDAIIARIQKQQRQRGIKQNLKIYALWKHELGTNAPPELWRSSGKVEYFVQENDSLGDWVKNAFERYSGQPWNWWPFDAPERPLDSGQVRIKWKCVSR